MLGIVIPVYKRKDCLREALESLTVQTMKRFYVIVVDDHSPEPLESVIDEFSDKLNIKYIYAEENGGPGAARQIGLEACYKAGFDLVMFMDSDDLLFPHSVSRLTYEINHSAANVVSSGIWVERKNEPGYLIQGDNKTWMHGKIYRTQYLKDNNIVFPPIRTNEDLAFNLSALEATEDKAILEEVLYLFRDEKNSLTRSGENDSLVNGADYINAIFYAAKYLKETIGLNDQMLINIMNCYNYYQNTIVFGGEIFEEVKERLRWLINLEELQKKLCKYSWMWERRRTIVQWVCFRDKIYYYPQTFKDWLEEYTNGNSNN